MRFFVTYGDSSLEARYLHSEASALRCEAMDGK
jgi:hypothetical protein